MRWISSPDQPDLDELVDEQFEWDKLYEPAGRL
jgi:nitroreductase